MKPATGKILLAFLVVAAAAAGWVWVQSRNGGAEVRYRLAKVERGAINAVVVASGTLNAVTTVQVGSQISGQIKEINADFNTPVKQGQVIARIDPATFELRVNQTRADLDAAASAVMVARSGLAAQQAELGRVKITLADAERDLARKKALVGLERPIIRAPVDGTVILRNVDAGQTVAASLQAPVLFTIARDLRDKQVEDAIDEPELCRLP